MPLLENLGRKRWLGSVVLVVAVLWAAPGESLSADWPMWRCDAGRTAATAEDLPAALHLQWVRRCPALEPAWSGVRDLSWTKEVVGLQEDRSIGFEVAYSPVVLGKTLFVGSSRNDSVTAIDVETGAEKWRFYASGPIRVAPAAWDGKVYAACDDGFLYCLGADDGKPLWTFRGAPMKHRIIGDERLVSAWPARGGPVVADGTVYFAAGIFPFMGVYIYAVDADTGRLIWVNDELGVWDLKGEKTAPQGPLAAVGNMLLVPNNRMSVTCLDRRTGKFLHHPPTTSHWRVGGAGDRFFLEARGGRGATLRDLKTGDLLAALSSVPVCADDTLFWADPFKDKTVIAGVLDKTRPADGADKPDANMRRLWSLRPSGLVREHFQVRLKAGARLYASSGKRLLAVDVPRTDGPAKESWNAELDAEVMEVLAAADRLFAVTIDGGIHCFGGDKTTARTHAIQAQEPPPAADAWTAKAEQVLKSAGVRDGYALVLGIGAGRLIEELIRQSSLTVVAVDSDADTCNALRRRLDAAGLYGKRAQVIQADPLDCGLPPYLASLIVSEDLGPAKLGDGAALARAVFHSLRPYGGVACLAAAQVSPRAMADRVQAAGLQNAEVAQQGEFTLLRRAGPLPGSACWTHQYADAGNTLCSTDDLVRAPLGLLWFGGPSTALAFDRHYCGPRNHVAGGRMFILGPKGLAAVDVYTGRVLWKADSPEIMTLRGPYLPADGQCNKAGANLLGSPYVSLADGIYVASGKTCTRLDPATGQKLAEIALPSEGQHAGSAFGPIRISDDLIVAAVDPIPAADNASDSRKLSGLASRRLLGFDRASGKVLWSLAAEQGFCHNAIAAGGGKVFCIDRWSADLAGEPRGGKLIALDARSGQEAWNADENVFGAWLAYSAESRIVLQGGYGARSPRESRAIAYDAASGKVLWDGKAGIGPWILNGPMLINQSRGACDIRTGKWLKSFKRLDGKSCDYDIGGTHLLADREFSVAYVDLDTGATYRLGGIRSGCMNNLICADGVLSYPYFGTGCGCGLNIRASMALIHMPELAKKKEPPN